MKCAQCHKKIAKDSQEIVREGKLVFCSETCRDAYMDANPVDKVSLNQTSRVLEATIEAPEFNGHNLSVTFNFWSGPKLYLDGTLQKSSKRKLFQNARIYEIKKSGKEDVEVRIESKFLDPTPVVKINGRSYPVTLNLRWYEYIWLGLPLILFLGGLIGALLGSITILINSRYFQRRQKIAEKYAMTGLIMVIGFFVFYHAAGIVNLGIKQYFTNEMQLAEARLNGRDPVKYVLMKHKWVVSNVIDKNGDVMEDRLAEYKGDIKTFGKDAQFTQLHRDGSKMTGTWHYVRKGHKILLNAGREIMVLYITNINDNNLSLLSRGITVEHHKLAESDTTGH